MGCASCGRANPPGARFCGGCGKSLAPCCPACGAESQANARFCIGCGAPLAARLKDPAGQALRALRDDPAGQAPRALRDDPAGQALRALRGDEAGERKVVTIVFADLIGSTALHERLDPESVNRIAWMATLDELAPDAISEPLYDVDVEEHGILSVGHLFGTLLGGGAFESGWVSLCRYRDGRIAGLELFEPEDLDRAQARFDELRTTAA
jgi:ketosteroid isomerase-like protein